MAKRKKKGAFLPYLKVVSTLVALSILLWYGVKLYQEVELNHAPPMDERVANEPSIGQIIAPLVEPEETITLIFEDELPEPIRAKRTEPTLHEKRHQIAIIIDDVGYDMKALRRLLALPLPITISILPDAPYAKQAAQMAYERDIPVMLHMPMQTTNLKYAAKMEDYYLHTAMSKSIFFQVFEDALAKVPHAIGVNNHMGSALTADTKSMQWLIELCKKHGLFFIDSRTSAASVGAPIAKKEGIAWNSRDIFLDHSINQDAMLKAWEAGLNCAAKNDQCIMLAHPHKETVSFLEKHLSMHHNQRFVFINHALK